MDRITGEDSSASPDRGCRRVLGPLKVAITCPGLRKFGAVFVFSIGSIVLPVNRPSESTRDAGGVMGGRGGCDAFSQSRNAFRSEADAFFHSCIKASRRVGRWINRASAQAARTLWMVPSRSRAQIAGCSRSSRSRQSGESRFLDLAMIWLIHQPAIPRQGLAGGRNAPGRGMEKDATNARRRPPKRGLLDTSRRFEAISNFPLL